jgi:hypothetical protein
MRDRLVDRQAHATLAFTISTRQLSLGDMFPSSLWYDIVNVREEDDIPPDHLDPRAGHRAMRK